MGETKNIYIALLQEQVNVILCYYEKYNVYMFCYLWRETYRIHISFHTLKPVQNGVSGIIMNEPFLSKMAIFSQRDISLQHKGCAHMGYILGPLLQTRFNFNTIMDM